MSSLPPRVVDSAQDFSTFRNTGSGDTGWLEEDGVVDELRERVADVLGERVVDDLRGGRDDELWDEGCADDLEELVADELREEECADELGEVAVDEPG